MSCTSQKRPSVGQRGRGRPRLSYLAQIASYIDVQKEDDAVKEISRRASDRKVWIKLIYGIKSPEPAPGEPAR